MTKPTKRTVTVSNKPSARTLKKLAESYFTAFVVLRQVEGLPEAAKQHTDQALYMLSVTLNEIAVKYEAQAKQPLNLDHIQQAFSPAESSTDVQEA